jgi:hypothetical protein
MGKVSLVGVGNGGDSTITLSTFTSLPGTVYSPMGGPSPVNFYQQTPTYAQTVCNGGMVLRNMAQQFNQVDGTTGETCSMVSGVSINGSATPGNQTCSLSNAPASSTPINVSDGTHTDAILNGSYYGMVFSGISGTGTGIVCPSVAFEQDSVTLNYVTVSTWGKHTVLNTSAVRYAPLTSDLTIVSTETGLGGVQCYLPAAVTLDHLQVLCDTNTGSNVSVSTRVQAPGASSPSNGNQTASIGTGVSATDYTHTDSCVAGTMANYILGASPSVYFDLINMRLLTFNTKQSTLMSTADANIAAASSYAPFIGLARSDEVKGEVVMDTPISGVSSKLYMDLTANSSTTGITATLQKGSILSPTLGSQTLSWASDAVGLLVDSTHTDSIVFQTDQFEVNIESSGSSTGSFQSYGMLFTAPGPALEDVAGITG